MIDRRARRSLPGADVVERHARSYLMDCEIRGLSPHTLGMRRRILAKLVSFLRENDLPCDRDALREFLAFVRVGGTRNQARGPQESPPAKPRTVQAYFVDLRTFFAYLLSEGVVDENPLDGLSKPIVRQDQVQPFTDGQVQALLSAAVRSALPRRNEAVLLFLLDTGARAAELCGLHVRDVDLEARCCTVLGKGNKSRRLYFSNATRRALWHYLRETPHDPEEPFFLSERGEDTGAGLTRSGLFLLFRRLGKAAGVSGVRCSPHTARHTFALAFLRAGGNTFTLKETLGHTSLAMTNRYVAFAQADLEAQHRQFSPVEALLGKNGRRP